MIVLLSILVSVLIVNTVYLVIDNYSTKKTLSAKIDSITNEYEDYQKRSGELLTRSNSELIVATGKLEVETTKREEALSRVSELEDYIQDKNPKIKVRSTEVTVDLTLPYEIMQLIRNYTGILIFGTPYVRDEAFVRNGIKVIDNLSSIVKRYEDEQSVADTIKNNLK